MNPLILADFYKMGHYNMYPKGITNIYDNFTPRKSRIKGIDEVVAFGLQYFIKEYLIKEWNREFFDRPKGEVINEYKRMMDATLGPDSVSMEHIEKLHDLGYLPLKIKSLPEGSLCPIGVPMFTIINTVDHAYWLPNYLETILSTSVWQSCTSATIAREYKKLLLKFAEKTGDPAFVQWQGHDFSMRGMSSKETACMSGAGHLLNFYGTDTIPAIAWLEKNYNADVTKELVGASVPATEHSVMCAGSKDGEIDTFRALMQAYPKGILSIVSDTWNLWDVLGKFLPELKSEILEREGKLVIRPDSGDPVDILCGLTNTDKVAKGRSHDDANMIYKGVIESLWDTFGGTINEKGYKVLDSHIGAIYGDSITLERAEQICTLLEAKGFASTNVVLGIGSYTYQYNTRDTFGFAMKATWCKINGVDYELFKDPITDDGTKKSAKGLLHVYKENGRFKLKDQCTPEEEATGELKVVFEDGELIKDWTLQEIRNNLNEKPETL